MQPEPTPHQDRRRWARADDVPQFEPVADKSNEPSVQMPLATVADLQDSLLVAMNDLKRLEGLLDHATGNLLERFNTAMAALHALPQETEETLSIKDALRLAVTELQFHDMASQLLVHTGKVLKGCAYKLAEDTMALDEDELGVVGTSLPERPNPVTQSEMDAGSIELF